MAEIGRDRRNRQACLGDDGGVCVSDSLAEVAVKLDACGPRDALRAETRKRPRAIRDAHVAGTFEAARALLGGADRMALEADSLR